MENSLEIKNRRIDPFMVAIDEDRCDAFAILSGVIDEDWGKLTSRLRKAGLLEVFIGFMNDLSKGEHERRWCKDEDCIYDYSEK